MWSSLALAASLSAASVQVAPTPSAPVAPVAPTARVEGPAPASALEARWLDRDHRLRTATFTTLGLTGAATIGLGIAGGLLVDRGRQSGDGSPQANGLIAAGVVFGAAVLSLAVSGVLWQSHRYNRPARLDPPPRNKTPQLYGPDDPRRDRGWVQRDRRLTRGMIGTGVVLGVALVGFTTSISLLFAPCNCEDRLGEVGGTIGMATLAVLAAVPLTALAITRRIHRRPLRAARARLSLTGGGLQLAF